jgi:hypothetical protein
MPGPDPIGACRGTDTATSRWVIQMSTSLELRAEIARLRLLRDGITDERARRAGPEMIDELERAAHELDNGSAAEN